MSGSLSTTRHSRSTSRTKDDAHAMASTECGIRSCSHGGRVHICHRRRRCSGDSRLVEDDSRPRRCCALRSGEPRSLAASTLNVSTGSRLTSGSLIQTTIGRLDVLRQVQPLGEFTSLRTVDMEVYGQRIRVPSRDDLIRVMRSVARPKDIEVALELEALRERDEKAER